MARLADGDRAAFDPLYEALWPLVSGFCGRRLGDRAKGEDAAQQALVRVFQKASLYDARRPALPWVLAFATWECRTLAGAASRRREDDLADAGVGGADPETELLRADLLYAVRALVGELGPSDEAALWAWMEHDLDRGPLGATLRKRVERARKRFVDLWRKRHGST
ncbi:MAG: sigma-70 family RNA polymerase sigma factor [Myxococcota bacterium]